MKSWLFFRWPTITCCRVSKDLLIKVWWQINSHLTGRMKYILYTDRQDQLEDKLITLVLYSKFTTFRSFMMLWIQMRLVGREIWLRVRYWNSNLQLLWMRNMWRWHRLFFRIFMRRWRERNIMMLLLMVRICPGLWSRPLRLLTLVRESRWTRCTCCFI